MQFFLNINILENNESMYGIFILIFHFVLQLGMRNYHLRRNTKWCPTLNLDKLWTLVSEQTRLKYKDAKPDGKVPVIDLVKNVSLFEVRK